MDRTFSAPHGLGGQCTPPPDKSITHRALMLAAVATGASKITHPLQTGDCISTRQCLQALGVAIEPSDGGATVRGVGLRGFREPPQPLDAENSGTTTRLLSGLIAGQPLFAVLTGDRSLLARPMGRVVTPLRSMGARIEGRAGGSLAPLCFLPGKDGLQPITWDLPVPSAQVKSSLFFAALRATGASIVGGRIDSRDHTERMLEALGVKLEKANGRLRIEPIATLPGFEVVVPGDVSSAAFFVAAALITGRKLEIRGCGVNPTRCGFLEVARRMGATVETRQESSSLGEPSGTVTVSPGKLRGARVESSEVPELVDEVPLLAVLGLFAEGLTEVRGAQELRLKESDRLAMISRMARGIGGNVEVFEDGFSVEGPQTLQEGQVDPQGDHRIAMAAAVAGAGIRGGVKVLGFECARVSYPDFIQDFMALGGQVD
jgi:3-phosphoshikimate 1-carboxyvinyltransferase